MITDMSESNGSEGRRLQRRREGRLRAGVCVGLADYFGVDVTLVRLGFGIFTVFWGFGVVLYLLAWVLLPEEGESSSILESFVGRLRL